MTDALAKEVAPPDMRATLVAPGAFRAEFPGGSLKAATTLVDEYADTTGKACEGTRAGHGKQQGDPTGGSRVVVEAESPSVHLLLGADALDLLRDELDDMRSETDAREAYTRSTDFDTTAAWSGKASPTARSHGREREAAGIAERYRCLRGDSGAPRFGKEDR